MPCWIAPRDVAPGHDYASEIVGGIEACAVFVLLLSEKANESGFVRREVERAASKDKPVVSVRLEEVTPSRALELFVSSEQWIDAWRTPRDDHWRRLADVIRSLRDDPSAVAPPQAPRATHAPRGIKFGLVALLVGAGLGGWLWWNHQPATQTTETPPPQVEAPSTLNQTADSGAPTHGPTQGADHSSMANDPCPQRLSINPNLPSPFSCQCSAEAVSDGTVWGTDAYTSDSSLCRAAAHAGVIPKSGGRVTVLSEAGRDLYVGTSRNGIATSDYGAYARSLRFEGGPPAPTGPEPCPQRLSVNPDLPTPFTCRCSAEQVRDGTVWGTDAYTDDSSLCRAAAHAGVIPKSGGAITALREVGRDLYVGTPRNGIASSDFGAYARSLRFEGGPPAPTGPEPCPQRLSVNPELPTPFTCLCSVEAVRDGTVWGSDPYTADSSLCRAALHAGAVGRGGGRITASRETGRDLYTGTPRNGVTSHDYGPYGASIRFVH